MLLANNTQRIEAAPNVEVINIRPIIARQSLANALGLAYNPVANVLYLAHGSGSDYGHIYTIDMQGTLLNDLDFQAVYHPGT